MTPRDRAARLCAELIREGVIPEGGAAHHRIHDVAVRVFGEWDSPPPRPAARYLDAKGNPTGPQTTPPE